MDLFAFDAFDGSVDTAGEKDLLTRLELCVQLFEVLLLLLHVDLRPDGVNNTHDDKQTQKSDRGAQDAGSEIGH